MGRWSELYYEGISPGILVGDVQLIGEMLTFTMASEGFGSWLVMLLYASAHLGAYSYMDINFWYSGVNHMKQREHVVFFRNA